MGSDGGGGPGDGRTGAVPAVAPPPAEIEGLVRSLIGMMRGGGITELDLAFGSVSIRLRGRPPAATKASVESPLVLVEAASEPAAGPSEHVITAPMIGTFYAAPAPGEPPFVEVGDAVEVGQVVGVIEAMKIMNEITADRAGVVTAILVANAQPVEYGFPLMRLATTGDGSP